MDCFPKSHNAVSPKSRKTTPQSGISTKEECAAARPPDIVLVCRVRPLFHPFLFFRPKKGEKSLFVLLEVPIQAKGSGCPGGTQLQCSVIRLARKQLVLGVSYDL